MVVPWKSILTKMYKRKIPIVLDCGLDLVAEVLYGKWKMKMLYFINKGYMRPSEMQRKIPAASRRVLNMQLKELEQYELIDKTIHSQIPLKVEYCLTKFGKSLIPVITALGNWGDKNEKRLRKLITKRSEKP